MQLKPSQFIASQENIGEAALHALIASGWTMYRSFLLFEAAQGTLPSELSEDTRREYAERSFRYVVELLPEGNPFRGALERYSAESLADSPQLKPSLKLV